jgi:phosphoribosylamine-glycine ligase
MNILIVSLDGFSVCIHPKILQEGHEAIWYVKNKDNREVGDGMIWKTDDPDSIASQADLILFDDNGRGMGEMADRYREKGYPVFGGGTFVDKLELDRLYGMEVFREHGIPIPETWEVRSLDDVKACLSENFGRSDKVVIKLDGADMAGSSFSFVAKNPELCREEVQHWVDDGLLEDPWSGIIQRFVEGIEVSTEAFWNGEEFSTHNIDLEEKKPFPGDLGPSVGCAYNTIIRIDSSSKLFKMVLEPLGPLLKEKGYVGIIDTNSIVDANGKPHALEFTPRFGYDSVPTLAWGNNHGFVNKILHIMGIGGEFEGFGYQGRVWAGVRVNIPPYPYESPDKPLNGKFYEILAENVPIINYEDVAENFYPYDIKKEDGKYLCPATSGMIGVAMGAGDDPRSAGLAAYKVAEKLQVPDKFYRALDGWKRGQAAWEELRAMKLVKLYPELS